MGKQTTNQTVPHSQQPANQHNQHNQHNQAAGKIQMNDNAISAIFSRVFGSVGAVSVKEAAAAFGGAGLETVFPFIRPST